MNINIPRKLAQQIVDTVKDVSGHDINFIEPSGVIIASTDERRIDTFHEIGQKAALTGETIEVNTDDNFTGTRKGVNLPIYNHETVLAVIGITGPPAQVRKYAHLAQRITNLLIREKELNTLSRTEAEKKYYIIQSLIDKDKFNYNFLSDSLLYFGFQKGGQARLLLIRLDSRYNLMNISMIEQKIINVFQLTDITLFTYNYPNEYLAVIEDSHFQQISPRLETFAASLSDVLDIAVGKSCSLYHFEQSYDSCLMGLKCLSRAEKNFVVFEDLTLELVLSKINTESKELFLNKVLSALNEEDLSLLFTYLEEDMSLSQTSKKLFLHQNTLQYRLDKIYQKSGLNPRKFRDAFTLYLAIKLQN